MNKIYKLVVLSLFIVAIQGFLWTQASRSEVWNEIKEYHFVVYYKSPEYSDLANRVLQEAERHYKRIAGQIGYGRLGNFWTWEDRVRIYIYDNQDEFTKATGLPAWSQAAAVRDQELLRSKIIVTFAQEGELTENILPHEICHLVLKDFIGFDKNLPLWFDEGLAQLQESDKRDLAFKLMQYVAEKNSSIPFQVLAGYNVRKEDNPVKATIFYAQSISVLDFLIKKHGIKRFQELCNNLREGKTFDESFAKAYISLFDSFDKVETKWLKYITN